MLKKVIEWCKSVFTKDNVKRFIHEAELSVVATASTTVNGFINNPANQAAAREAVFAVAKDGLSGNEALDAAVGRLKDAGLAAGRVVRSRSSNERDWDFHPRPTERVALNVPPSCLAYPRARWGGRHLRCVRLP